MPAKKAEWIAAVEGLVVTNVVEVTTKERSDGMSGIVDKALASNSEVDFSPTPITVTMTVEAVFQLSEE